MTSLQEEFAHPIFDELATARAREYLSYIRQGESTGRVAKRFGVTREAVKNALCIMRRRARARGWNPDEHLTRPAPEGFRVKGVSQYFDGQGNLRGEWRLLRYDAEQQAEIAKAWIRGLASSVEGLSAPPVVAARASTRRLCVIPLGDAHVGLLTWAREVGDSFDLDICADLMRSAIRYVLSVIPDCDEVLIINLGDFYHTNGSKNTTPASGHFLDADGRWAKIYERGVQITVDLINQAATKAPVVRYRANPGNHDPETSMTLSIALSCFFSNSPNVCIETSPSAFWYYRWGRTLIGTCHGDKVKPPQLPLIMATDRPQDWGETVFRYFYLGHVHHRSAKEYPGCTVESFGTLAPGDAYAFSHGYRSRRTLSAIVIDDYGGEIGRYQVDAENLVAGYGLGS